jgi:exopolyphosphatase/guanosine-5'-triphosphate,3'-diphosphate pyrophosphatase
LQVAAVDIGTNTVLLLVATRGADGRVVAVREEATITRLGQDVDRTRALHSDAILRTNECLSRYAEILRDAGGAARVRVVGTSAMRDAAGNQAVRDHVARVFGVGVDVISGVEEAELTGAGALSGLTVPGPVVVFDIGGGSTECLLGNAPGAAGVSVDIGSVRATERWLPSDPPTAAEIDRATREIATLVAPLRDVAAASRSAGGEGPPVGVAGTMTTLAAVALRMETYDGARVHGHTLTRARVEAVVRDLAALAVDERRRVPGVHPKRADVIVGGGLVALACLDALDASEVVVSDRGIRWGVAERLLEAAPPTAV